MISAFRSDLLQTNETESKSIPTEKIGAINSPAVVELVPDAQLETTNFRSSESNK